MARTVNFSLKAEKIKQQVDELAAELESKKAQRPVHRDSHRIQDIHLDDLDFNTLLMLQTKISKLLIEKSK
jgi:hypothetical protein